MRCRSSLAGLPCLFEISSSDQMRSGARTSPMRGMPVIAERLNLVVLNLKGAVPLVAANRYSSDPRLARRRGCLHPFNFTRSPLRKTIIYVVTLIAARQNMRSPRSSRGGRERDGETAISADGSPSIGRLSSGRRVSARIRRRGLCAADAIRLWSDDFQAFLSAGRTSQMWPPRAASSSCLSSMATRPPLPPSASAASRPPAPGNPSLRRRCQQITNEWPRK